MKAGFKTGADDAECASSRPRSQQNPQIARINIAVAVEIGVGVRRAPSADQEAEVDRIHETVAIDVAGDAGTEGAHDDVESLIHVERDELRIISRERDRAAIRRD